MNFQSTITIPVPPEIAEAYALSTEEDRQKMAEKIAFFLKATNLSRQKSIQKL